MPSKLGFAGLIPAFSFLTAVLLGGPEWHFVGLAAGYGYIAIIFSFVGGTWWGLAAAAGEHQSSQVGWVYLAAIVPSLIGFALFLPWVFAAEWPGPSLVWLGIAILLSPIVDRLLRLAGIAPDWWMSLRLPLSVGLGGAALVMGIAA